jgi:hypothetical protein
VLRGKSYEDPLRIEYVSRQNEVRIEPLTKETARRGAEVAIRVCAFVSALINCHNKLAAVGEAENSGAKAGDMYSLVEDKGYHLPRGHTPASKQRPAPELVGKRLRELNLPGSEDGHPYSCGDNRQFVGPSEGIRIFLVEGFKNGGH